MDVHSLFARILTGICGDERAHSVFDLKLTFSFLFVPLPFFTENITNILLKYYFVNVYVCVDG